MLTDNRASKHGPIKVLLVDPEAGQRDAAKTVLAGINEIALDIIDAGSADEYDGKHGAADLVMFAFGDGGASEVRSIKDRCGSGERPPMFVALLRQRSAELMKRALRAGADEAVPLPLDPLDAMRALLKITENKGESLRRGLVWSFTSMSGGVGVSTAACGLAQALKHTADRRVALVDFDLQAGDLPIMLNLEPGHSLADLHADNGKLDSIALDTVLCKHDSGVYLLAAPNKVEESEQVSVTQVGTILDVMQELFDVIVVDCGSHVSENALAVWERSERIFYVLDQSISGVRRAWRFFDLIGRLGLGRLRTELVLNRFSLRRGVSEEHIGSALARAINMRLPMDEASLDAAINSAKDLWTAAPRGALTRSLEDWARALCSGGSRPAGKAPGMALIKWLFTPTAA